MIKPSVKSTENVSVGLRLGPHPADHKLEQLQAIFPDVMASSILWKLRKEIWIENAEYNKQCAMLCNAEVYLMRPDRQLDLKTKWGK